MPSTDAWANKEHTSWLADIAVLDDDELLALAYTFSHSSRRLRGYMELFRGRMGQRAQFAACLICFDLAQKGDAQMASQFAFLQGTMTELGRNQTLVETLVGKQQYLRDLWKTCCQTLDLSLEALPHDAPGVAESFGVLRAADAPVLATLQLLDDSCVDEAALQVDEQAMWNKYVQGCEAFFGGSNNTGYDGSMGFRLRGHHGQARAQSFDMALEQCQRYVAPAKGMRPLLQLAWGLSLKNRGLLGQQNKRRQHLLTQGLLAFLSAGYEAACVAQAISPLYADSDVWPAIVDLIADYQRFLCRKLASQWPAKSADHPLWVEEFVALIQAH